jgi:hypothetical protein
MSRNYLQNSVEDKTRQKYSRCDNPDEKGEKAGFQHFSPDDRFQ